jgi:hypothetical protein
LEARCVWDAEVGGSSPPTPTEYPLEWVNQILTVFIIIAALTCYIPIAFETSRSTLQVQPHLCLHPVQLRHLS